MVNSHKITGKLILKATITNKSPLLIATGKGEATDFEIIRDKGGKGDPFIPAAGFAGMLRASFDGVKSNFDTMHFQAFWGMNAKEAKEAENAKPKKQVYQSHIIIDDLKMITSSEIVVRDGVAIDSKTGIAKTGQKYDYELLEPGATFFLNMEITLRGDFNKDTFLQFLHFMIQKGKKEEYQQGAFKSNGFGILKWDSIEVFSFDFPTDGQTWFDYLENEAKDKDKKIPFNRCKVDVTKIPKLPVKASSNLSIIGTFAIKNSLIISENSGTSGPDKTHLKDSGGTPLLTAKSIRGPIRHRALRILNTIGKADAEGLIDSLFGFVNEDNKKAQKGRFKTFETEIRGADSEQIQPRIKIDRFTGGTIESALMSTQPLWHKDETIHLRFEIENCKQEEAGLILLIMKDLMTADLPIGGEKAIGRGVLTGISLDIKGQVQGMEKEVEISFDDKGIKDKTDEESIKLLNEWVESLINHK